MAVPTTPTVAQIVTEALKRAGRTTPTSTQITDATNNQLQEVKADIMLACPTHPSLKATATAVSQPGQQRYFVPDDFNEMDSITLLDGPEEWRGLARGGTPDTITLASTFSANSLDVLGKYILLTDGPGFTQYRQILNYTDSTKVLYVDVDWSPTPTAATSYQVVTMHSTLWPLAIRTELDRIDNPTTLGTPRQAALQGEEFLLYPVPERASYGLVSRYFVDLSMLDEAKPLFLRLLREWRSLWVQGIAVKSMQRYDEDRYQLELSVYTKMLDLLGTQTCTVRQMRQND